MTSNNVSKVTVSGPHSGYKDGVYKNIPLSGGNGTGLLANFTIESGVIKDNVIFVKEGGCGYTNGDFLIQTFPEFMLVRDGNGDLISQDLEILATVSAGVSSITLTNPGSGYTFPPFVEVVDNCDQGYGSVARATIKDGKVDTIYVVSEGENYPVDEVIPYIVENVSVIDPGQDYEDGDRVVDNQGNE